MCLCKLVAVKFVTILPQNDFFIRLHANNRSNSDTYRHGIDIFTVTCIFPFTYNNPLFEVFLVKVLKTVWQY